MRVSEIFESTPDPADMENFRNTFIKNLRKPNPNINLSDIIPDSVSFEAIFGDGMRYEEVFLMCKTFVGRQMKITTTNRCRVFDSNLDTPNEVDVADVEFKATIDRFLPTWNQLSNPKGAILVTFKPMVTAELYGRNGRPVLKKVSTGILSLQDIYAIYPTRK